MSSRIEDLDFNISTLSTKSGVKTQLTFDDSIIPKGRNITNTMSFTATVDKSLGATAKRLHDLFSNGKYAIINFSSTVDDELNGLYMAKSGTVSQGVGVYTINFTGEGPFKRYKWIIGGEEIITDWDIIATENFTEGGSTTNIAEGTEGTLDSGHIWKACIGNWRVEAADDYLESVTDSGFNHCVLKAVNGKYYLAISDVIVKVKVSQSASNSVSGLCLRFQDDGDTNQGNGYSFAFSTNNDVCEFSKHIGSSTTILKSWNISYDVAVATYYTLIVYCQGNRFDCYFDGEYLGTVFDDTYPVGWYGCSDEDTPYGRYDDFSLEHAKPLVLHLPVGAYDYNQVRMPTTIKQNDDTSENGTVRTVVEPSNSVNFRQTDFSGGLNTISGEVKVYDFDDPNYNRVRNMDHFFVGNIVVDNGLIRLKVESSQITLSVYSNSVWEDLVFNRSWSSLTQQNADYGFIELGKHRVVLRESIYYSTGSHMDSVWTDYIITTGSSMIQIDNRRAL